MNMTSEEIFAIALNWAIGVGIPIFVLYAIVSFVLDAIHAKKVGRHIRVKRIVIFVLGIILLLLYIAGLIFLYYLRLAVAKGM